MSNACLSGAVCGGEVTGAEGEIRSPGYPHGYAAERRCEWLIIAPPGKRIKLEFLEFDVQQTDGRRRLFCRDHIQVKGRYFYVN